MNPERLRPRIAPTGRITLRLTPEQRNRFERSRELPRGLVHTLRHAPVREGKLTVRVTRHELEALAAAVAQASAADREEKRALATLLRYLEEKEDRFLEEAPQET